jgi:hypothetical protein
MNTLHKGDSDDNNNNIPERVINVNGTAFVWDVPVITDRTILENRLDIVLRDKIEKTCLLNDIHTPDDSNLNTK